MRAKPRSSGGATVHADQCTNVAEALTARFPDPLDVCFFCSSGSEANELALKITLTVTGRRGILGVEGNYHGNTLLPDALERIRV